MKITGIEIDEYRQFKNIKFDFTYPEGHPKEGQPLEKVCFIGQSGTGKTTLLDLLMLYFRAIAEANDSVRLERSQADIDSDFLYDSFLVDATVKCLINDRLISLSKLNGEAYKLLQWFVENKLRDDISTTDKLCLYISESIANESLRVLRKESKRKGAQIDFVKMSSEGNEETEDDEELNRFINQKIVKIGTGQSSVVWRYLLNDINLYDTNLNRIALSMVNGININHFSANKLVEKINNWKSKNVNPRIDLAEKCLNKILERFFLEVDVDDSEAPIVLKTKAGVSIKSYVVSNGTRQIIATAIPLYKFNTSNAVILFDEPERSLFPDIQRELIKYYSSLAPRAQFFYATHSPIIASAFEPCERFILYFNENGQVNFHRGIAPEGDDPNDILRQDFDMSELMLEKGIKEYERYRRLGMQIREETDEEKKNQLIAERLELGNRYNFAGRNA